LANHRSAIKRHRQSIKARMRNRAMKTKVKHAVKAVRAAVEQKDMEKASEALRSATSVLDKAATKKIIHKRNASRHISRLADTVNSLNS
jgi:small subunit ribosomal protein S20